MNLGGILGKTSEFVARIAELIDLFGAADTILARTLDNALSRAAFGFDDG